MGKLTESSFFPLVFPSVFHSAWLVPWQGGMGWDDGRGLVVSSGWLGDGLPLPPPPPSFSSFSHLVPLTFFLISLPLLSTHLFSFQCTLFPASLLFFCLFLHSFTPSLLAPRDDQQFKEMGWRGRKKESVGHCAVAWTITCYNISQSSLFLIFSLSLFSPLSFVFCIFQAGKTVAFSFSFDTAPAHLYVPPPTTISHAPNDEPTPFSPPLFLYISSSSSLFWHYNCVKPGTTSKILPEVQI